MSMQESVALAQQLLAQAQQALEECSPSSPQGPNRADGTSRADRTTLVEGLVEQQTSLNPKLFARRLELVGLRLGEPLDVVVIVPVNTTVATLIEAAERLVPQPALIALHADHVCAFTPSDPARSRTSLAESFQALGILVAIGAHGPDRSQPTLAQPHDRARIAAQASAASGRIHAEVDYEALTAIEVLLGARTPADLEGILEVHLGPLQRYDDARRTELVDTLDQLIASGQQVQVTATALHLHVNTLRQRLARIDQLLGEQWRDPEAIIDLAIALQIRRLLHA